MTNLLDKQPDDPKAEILKMLQAIETQGKTSDPHDKTRYRFDSQFLHEEDFEAIFDSYDVLGSQVIPKAYLYHALKMVGVEEAEEVVKSRYEELIEDDYINKVSFCFVLETEHKRLGFQN